MGLLASLLGSLLSGLLSLWLKRRKEDSTLEKEVEHARIAKDLRAGPALADDELHYRD